MDLLTSKSARSGHTDVKIDDFFEGRIAGHEIGFGDYQLDGSEGSKVLAQSLSQIAKPFLKNNEGIFSIFADGDEIKIRLKNQTVQSQFFLVLLIVVNGKKLKQDLRISDMLLLRLSLVNTLQVLLNTNKVVKLIIIN